MIRGLHRLPASQELWPTAFRCGQTGAALACAAGILAAGACIGLYRADAERLRAVATAVASGANDDAGRVVRITRWVYANHGFRRNPGCFLWPNMRATPVQVLERGGDCADKSRLLAAMLRQIGIPATMLMCFHPQSGAPVHTVVEAALDGGERLVLDPVFDMTFPRPDGGYFGLQELRRDAEILQQRLRDLRAVRPSPFDPIQAYHEHSAVYSQAATINWNKNSVTRAALAVLHRVLGDEVYRMPRPIVVEEPHLASAAAFGMLAILCAPVLAAAARLVPKASPAESMDRSFNSMTQAAIHSIVEARS